MSFSVSELSALAEKAARGSGAEPAQAAHFGAAFVAHLAAGRGFGAVRAALLALPGGPIQVAPMVAPADAELAASYGARGASLPARLACPEEVLAFLAERAQQCYVPNSAASRQGGAGAGLTDGD